jgi:hypothetical protein
MREYAEEDSEDGGQYEFPEVEKALPEYIRKTLKCDRRPLIKEARGLLSKHRNGRYGSWIERLRKIESLSRIPLRTDRKLKASIWLWHNFGRHRGTTGSQAASFRDVLAIVVQIVAGLQGKSVTFC